MKKTGIDSCGDFDFGKTSEDYALFRDIYPQSMYDRLIEAGVGREGQEILDLGSGTAVLPMNMYGTGARFTATDIAENQIACGKRIAGQRGMDRIAFKVCPAEETGFADSRFDAVTAVQCFLYFDAERAAREIYRVLKPGGLFCKIFMDWLPFEDEKLAEMESLVLKYNPAWTGGGFSEYNFSFPEWAKDRFVIEKIYSYDEELSFSKENWIGRVRTCRAIGAALSPEKAADFESEYRSVLEKYDEPLMLKHQIHIEIYRSVKPI